MSDDDLRGWEFVCTTAELLPGEKRNVWAGDTAIPGVQPRRRPARSGTAARTRDFELSSGTFDAAEGSINASCMARFDVRDGRALCAPPSRRWRSSPVRVVDGAVYTRDDRG